MSRRCIVRRVVYAVEDVLVVCTLNHVKYLSWKIIETAFFVVDFHVEQTTNGHDWDDNFVLTLHRHFDVRYMPGKMRIHNLHILMNEISGWHWHIMNVVTKSELMSKPNSSPHSHFTHMHTVRVHCSISANDWTAIRLLRPKANKPSRNWFVKNTNAIKWMKIRKIVV